MSQFKTMLMFLIAALAGLAQAMPASANDFPTQTVRISGYRSIGAGEFMSVSLPGGAAYVRKIYLQVDSYYGTQLQVIANGEVKGNFIVPGYDPSFTVNVSEVVSQISIQNLGSRGARIHAIHAEIATYPAGYPYPWAPAPMPVGPVLGGGALTVAANLASQAIVLVDQLESFSDVQEYVTYLLPIKKIAGRTYATANARGDLSARVSELLVALRNQIDFAAPYLDNFMERDLTFGTSVSLLGLREQIDRLIQ